MIKYIKQDISKIDFGVVCHGVNYVGVMGAGVAAIFKKVWPKCFTEYQAFITEHAPEKEQRKTLLGQTNIVEINEGLYIANCFTQGLVGFDGQLASPVSIYQSLNVAFDFAKKQTLPLYLCKIGAGLGGLDWDKDVEPVVSQLVAEYQWVDTYVCIWG